VRHVRAGGSQAKLGRNGSSRHTERWLGPYLTDWQAQTGPEGRRAIKVFAPILDDPSMDAIARSVADRLHENAAELASILAGGLGLGPREQAEADLRNLLEGVAAGVEFSCPGLVDRQLAWLKIRSRALGGDVHRLEQLPQLLLQAAGGRLDAPQLGRLREVLAGAAVYVRFAPDSIDESMDRRVAADSAAGQLLAAALRGDRIMAQAVIERAESIVECLEHTIEPMLREVGRLWQEGHIHPAQEHLVSAFAHDAIVRLATRLPALAASAPLVVLVRSHGDEHSLGQSFVEVYAQAEGLRTRRLVAPSDLGAAISMLTALQPRALLISCTTMGQMRRVKELTAAVRCDRQLAAIPVLLGGAVFVGIPHLATQLGADGGGTSGRLTGQLLRQMLVPDAVPA
jgi:methanogenic corrinoid protein MtbC1